MAELIPDKKDLELIFRRLRSISSNKVCFDCTAKNPTWASITYGVFICIDCSAVHRSLGVHLTFVRSTQLDTNWNWLQIRQMQLGGNANADSFFQQHNCITKDAQQKYNSRAAQLYKEKLQNASVQAMKTHGTKLFFDHDIDLDTRQDENKEYDFFEDLTFSKQAITKYTDGASITSSENVNKMTNDRKGPSITMNTSLERKTIIGSRKPLNKRNGGIGNKKGLGAQKVSTNFEDVEKEAVLTEKMKVHTEKETEEQNKEANDEAQVASVRLAYEDLSLKQKKETDKLKMTDPKKAAQMERLGMGLGSRTGISHSALSDMKTIHQESSTKFSNKSHDVEVNDFFDDIGSWINSSNSCSSFSPLYKKKSQARTLPPGTDENEDAVYKDLINYANNFTTYSSYDNSSKSHSAHDNKSKSHSNFDSNSKPQNNYNIGYKSSNNNVKMDGSLPSNAATDAQKKFGTAKSISSDQYFSDSMDNTWEQKSNLSRFEGSTSISSADYFGRSENAYQRNYIPSQLQAPDLEEVRESVKQSVNKVAGKLSSLASGVISSIQDKYGGY